MQTNYAVNHSNVWSGRWLDVCLGAPVSWSTIFASIGQRIIATQMTLRKNFCTGRRGHCDLSWRTNRPLLWLSMTLLYSTDRFLPFSTLTLLPPPVLCFILSNRMERCVFLTRSGINVWRFHLREFPFSIQTFINVEDEIYLRVNRTRRRFNRIIILKHSLNNFSYEA